VNLEVSNVSVDEFVGALRSHSQNEWRNPAGFVRDLSKRFRSKTQVAADPVTAAEADERNYRCSICYSRTRGEGAISGADGKLMPCTCASPEWIARQRARGIFAEEPPQ